MIEEVIDTSRPSVLGKKIQTRGNSALSTLLLVYETLDYFISCLCEINFIRKASPFVLP